MTPRDDTPQERDDKATDLESTSNEKAKQLARERRRDRLINYGLYAVSIGLVVFVAFLYGQAQEDQDSLARTQQGLVRVVTVQGAQGLDVVQKARYGCEGLNQLREFQGDAIELQIRTTRKSLDTPGGLKELESFRPLVEAQQDERKQQVRRLRRYTSKFPVSRHPYRVDCARAHPLPAAKAIKPSGRTLDHPAASRPG